MLKCLQRVCMAKQLLINHRLTFFPVPAGSAILSGFISFITHTADITSFTPAGGFFIDFTMVTSEG